MKKQLYYSLPLFGNQFKGECQNFTQFFARFQIWAKQFGIDNVGSLSLWFAGSGKETKKGFAAEEEASILAHSLINKLPKREIVDLSN